MQQSEIVICVGYFTHTHLFTCINVYGFNYGFNNGFVSVVGYSVGDVCTTDVHCETVSNTFCLSRTCSCVDGYFPVMNRSRCDRK